MGESHFCSNCSVDALAVFVYPFADLFLVYLLILRGLFHLIWGLHLRGNSLLLKHTCQVPDDYPGMFPVIISLAVTPVVIKGHAAFPISLRSIGTWKVPGHVLFGVSKSSGSWLLLFMIICGWSLLTISFSFCDCQSSAV